jgi:DNA-binding transcriptional MerR regulator
MTPSNPDDARYTLTDLADMAGVTPRTVRYYLAQGLLPSVGIAGPGAKYDDTHLARLRLIRRLQREHQPLAEIRHRLESMDDETVLALAEVTPEPPPDSALDYIQRVTSSVAARPMSLAAHPPMPLTAQPPMLARRMREVPTEVYRSQPAAPPPLPVPLSQSQRSQWERIGLAPDVELHIRRPLSRSTAKRVDRLIEIARDLLEEDPS